MTLKRYLLQHELTDQDFADRAALTQSYVSRMKRGLVTPSLEVALRIVKLTGGEVTAEELLPHKVRGGDDRKAV